MSGRIRLLGRLRPERAAPRVTARPSPASSAGEDLRRRRDELAAQVAELYWDLGGLTYEMAIRDHFRLDVLVRRAAALQQLDGELAEAERLLLSEQTGAVGACATCGAPHSRGAVFCWQCGTGLLAQVPATEGGPTVAMPTASGPSTSSTGSTELESPRSSAHSTTAPPRDEA